MQQWRERFAVAMVAVSVVLLAVTGSASAHEPGTSAVDIEVTADGIGLVVEVPVEELGLAVGEEVPTTVFGLSQKRDLIAGYIDGNLEVAAGGERWMLSIGRLTVVRIDGIDFVRAVVAAEGPWSGVLTIRDRMILESDDAHQIIFTVSAAGATTIAGIVDADVAEIAFERGPGGSLEVSAGSSFVDTMMYGFDHVLEGADHVLFLLTLLLPAPLIVSKRRWQRAPSLWRSTKKVVHVATAFTAGHSISLLASASGLITLPSKPVEILIALSVGVSALHALRPLADRGEVLIGVGFGLVHGLAFAELLNNFALGRSNTLQAMLGFNLGVELAQLATIALAFPPLWLLAQTRAYSTVRFVGAAVALVLSIAWILDRLGVVASPFTSIEEEAMGWLMPMAAALAAVAAVATIATRRFAAES